MHSKVVDDLEEMLTDLVRGIGDGLGMRSDDLGVRVFAMEGDCYLVTNEEGSPLCAESNDGLKALCVFTDLRNVEETALQYHGKPIKTTFQGAIEWAKRERLQVLAYWPDGTVGDLLMTHPLPEHLLEPDPQDELPF